MTTDDIISQQFPALAGVFDDAPGRAAQAAAAGDYRAALDQATRLELAAGELREVLLREVLATGAGWQEIAGLLGIHPQQAFEACAALAGHLLTPAQQRPGCALVLTAGLAAVHDIRPEYGIDIEDLGPGHSLHAEPGVRKFTCGCNCLPKYFQARGATTNAGTCSCTYVNAT